MRILVLLGCLVVTACTSREPDPSDPHGSDGPGFRRAVATALEGAAGCQGEGPNNHVADLTWRPADPPGDAQRLVLSYLEDGLDTDAFVPTPKLPAGLASYRWEHLDPGTGPRYWRVLTLRGDTWEASSTATFSGVDCADVP